MINSPTYWPEFPVHVLVKGDVIDGDLCIPRNAKGVVVFVYGSGGGRLSPELKYITSVVQKAEIGTLCIDLLTDEENAIPDNQVNLPLLTTRLLSVIHWLWSNDQTVGLPIGLFGAGAGATAVLKAASELGEEVKAIVTRGASYDLIHHELHMVKAPTLLLVSSSNDSMIAIHDQAFHALCCPKKLEIIPGMSSRADREGVSEIVASLATTWFRKHLSSVSAPLAKHAVET
jgi:putative phosphoribosyl transferase